MKQLTIFDIEESVTLEIIPRQGIIKNQVSIFYKGIHVANARDCGNGIYEFRPRVGYFYNSRVRMMDRNEMEDFCKRY